MTLKFLQINLQHNKAATAVLCQRILKDKLDIVLIQEPWCHGGRVSGLNSVGGEIIYDSKHPKPRACIFVSRKVTVLPLLRFCSRDLSVAKVKTNNVEGPKEIIVASAYFPYDLPEAPPKEVNELVTSCRDEHLLIGCDANAHHTIWGSSDINRRGESVLEFLLENNLEVFNIGNSATFKNSIRQEVIDLTIGTQFVGTLVEKWQVSDEPSLSDHNHICFEFNTIPVQDRIYRNPRKTDWEAYTAELSGKTDLGPQRLINNHMIEISSILVTQALQETYECHCPPVAHKSKREVPWWNKELQKLRVNARKLFNKAKKNRRWDNYKEAINLYNTKLRRAKRQSWCLFCEKLESVPLAARINNIFKSNTQKQLRTVKDGNDEHTKTGKDTLSVMMRAHFPGSNEISEPTNASSEPLRRGSRRDWRKAKEIFTYNRIKWAINSFEPYKSSGKDGIFPALLQHAPRNIIQKLCAIFRASMAIGYIPEIWRAVRVVFIPKPGRPSYENAKDYRPISLTSFCLKTMEKVIDKYIRETYLMDNPLHANQHAYRAGRSVDTALHCLVERIEKVLTDKEVCLASFVDIEGAFDNASFKSIEEAATAHGVDSTTVKWIKNMLQTRKVFATCYGETVWVKVRKGCPQGGVLSPLLWALIINSLLKRLNEEGIYSQGYADDVCIFVRGKFLNIISEINQRGLEIIDAWCKEVELSVNPAKTIVVPFTNRRTLDGLKEPILNGIRIGFSKQVKYLGVILDSKLSWAQHLDKAVAKAKQSLWLCKQTIGKTWGLKPKMVLWIYKMIVRPSILFASVVWWPRVKLRTVQQQLSGVQRLACLAATGVMRTVPTAALETLLNLPPLHIQVEIEAKSVGYRIKQSDLWKGGNTPHMRIDFETQPIFGMISDKMLPRYSFQNRFEIIIPTRQEWESGNVLRQLGNTTCYTDGSKMETGTGAGVYSGQLSLERTHSLGNYCSVFLSEVYAVLDCADELVRKDISRRQISILSDSQAALKAFTNPAVTSKLVWNCIERLNTLATNNKVKLIWIPGHKGHEGNEKADELARMGSEQKFQGPEPAVGLPFSTIKQFLKEELIAKHLDYWRTLPGLRQAKEFIKKPDSRTTNELLKLTRNELRKVVGILTGHNTLNRHLHIMGIRGSPLCRRCDREEETSKHVTCDCTEFDRARLESFGKLDISPGEILHLGAQKILTFLGKSGLCG